MKGLSRESRLLIDAAREGDDPSAADRKRVRSALARKLAIGAAAGAVAATATHAAAGGVVGAAGVGTSGAAAGTAAGAGIGAGAVAGAGAASGAAAGTASVAAGALATGLGAKLLVSVAIVGVMSAGTVGYVRHEAAKRADAHVIVGERASAPSAPAKKSAPIPAPAPVAPVAVTTAPAAVAPDVAADRLAPVAKRVAPTAAPSPPSDLDVELALLQEAHGALQMKDGARALRLLDEHARRFPNGALGEESEAARVFALCQLGRTSEAHDLAGRFLREHPRSPLAPRVMRECQDPSTF